MNDCTVLFKSVVKLNSYFQFYITPQHLKADAPVKITAVQNDSFIYQRSKIPHFHFIIHFVTFQHEIHGIVILFNLTSLYFYNKDSVKN